jgi:hypothetical protein
MNQERQVCATRGGSDSGAGVPPIAGNIARSREPNASRRIVVAMHDVVFDPPVYLVVEPHKAITTTGAAVAAIRLRNRTVPRRDAGALVRRLRLARSSEDATPAVGAFRRWAAEEGLLLVLPVAPYS